MAKLIIKIDNAEYDYFNIPDKVAESMIKKFNQYYIEQDIKKLENQLRTLKSELKKYSSQK